ncbi:type I-E CRISPR-associated protein Cas6/Cse3/CasE [Lactiplantibacillus paraxiangfangensis]|uniref:type I-E CRISPR-associated protein Cas6/Cse3/CasE n=1 Tax=Lactiplantibacillus paraxiangfangensis TaxID=3076224 RepID=UPI0030C78555
MYYLSRVQVDVNNRYKTKDLTHLGAFHNWVEQSFPDEIATGERHRHLWRLDVLAGKTYLLILSESKPDSDLLERYGVPGTAITKSYDKFLDRIQDGQLMQFRLTANPTHTVTRPGEKQGRVMPHITVERQCKWLMDRADKLGFQLIKQVSADEPELSATPAFDIVNRDWPTLHRKVGRGVRLSRVTFEGLLRVSDVVAFRQTLVTGIGREKAFGMGLMTVIPED